MAPDQEWMIDDEGGSPTGLFLALLSSVSMLGSLFLVTMVCACGKKEPEPTMDEPKEQPPPEQQPVEQPPAAPVEEKPVEETKSAKTAASAKSVTETSSKLGEKGVDLQLTSQVAPSGGVKAPVTKTTAGMPSLKLMGAESSRTGTASQTPKMGSKSAESGKSVSMGASSVKSMAQVKSVSVNTTGRQATPKSVSINASHAKSTTVTAK